MCSDMEGSGPFCNERGCCQNAIIIKKLGCILSYYVIKTRELIRCFISLVGVLNLGIILAGIIPLRNVLEN